MTRKLNGAVEADSGGAMDAMADSAQQIWQAGLGAFAKARDDGGDIVARLLRDGAELQARMQQLAGERISAASDTLKKIVGTIGSRTVGPIEKVEKLVEARVSRTLRNIGVPMRDDVEILSREIEDLWKTVRAMSPRRPSVPRPKTLAEMPPPKKPAAGTRPASVKTTGRRTPGTRAASSRALKRQPKSAATRH